MDSEFYDGVERLKSFKVADFNTMLDELKQLMHVIGKPSLQLYASEPIANGHLLLQPEKRYAIVVTKNRATFTRTEFNNVMTTTVIDDEFLKTANWFQVYIYTVEMDLEIQKIRSHIDDSLFVSEAIQ